MLNTVKCAALGLAAAASVLSSGVAAEANPRQKPAKLAFGKTAIPSAQAPQAIGGYAKGCLAGAATLPADGPGWQAMRLSRNRRHAHPALIAYIRRLSAKAREIGWPGLMVGDLAQARGGPMLTGHASHQTGLDGDIWLRPSPAKILTVAEREKVSAINYVARDRRTVIAGFTPEHHAVLRAAAEDPAVARIFVNAAIKKALCVRAQTQGEPMDWLRKIRPWWGHDHHFHVRLNCPDNSPDCQPQKDPPPGPGCGQDVDSWLTPQALNPKPTPPTKKRKPKAPLTLADLPAACGGVLNAASAAAPNPAQ